MLRPHSRQIKIENQWDGVVINFQKILICSQDEEILNDIILVPPVTSHQSSSHPRFRFLPLQSILNVIVDTSFPFYSYSLSFLKMHLWLKLLSPQNKTKRNKQVLIAYCCQIKPENLFDLLRSLQAAVNLFFPNMYLLLPIRNLWFPAWMPWYMLIPCTKCFSPTSYFMQFIHSHPN